MFHTWKSFVLYCEVKFQLVFIFTDWSVSSALYGRSSKQNKNRLSKAFAGLTILRICNICIRIEKIKKKKLPGKSKQRKVKLIIITEKKKWTIMYNNKNMISCFVSMKLSCVTMYYINAKINFGVKTSISY
jgi:hypothetical protein